MICATTAIVLDKRILLMALLQCAEWVGESAMVETTSTIL
jgi:hypothetical protein